MTTVGFQRDFCILVVPFLYQHHITSKDCKKEGNKEGEEKEKKEEENPTKKKQA